MRRDLDLVRDILKTCADSTGPVDAATFTDDTHPLESIVYHIRIMREAGLIHATVTSTWDGVVRARVDSLTWEGNDFLDSVRSNQLWAKTKQRIASTVGSVAFSVVKDVATSIATTMIGL